MSIACTRRILVGFTAAVALTAACGGGGSSGNSAKAACQKATDARNAASVPSPDPTARDPVNAYSDALNAAHRRLEEQIPSIVAAFKDAPARLHRDAERLVDSTTLGYDLGRLITACERSGY